MNLAYSLERIADSKEWSLRALLRNTGLRVRFGTCCLATAALLAITCFFLTPLLNAEATPTVSAQELLENAEKYDGKSIIFKGEVIGEVMIRRDIAWINVRDKTGAIGIFCPKGLINEIKYQGSYKYKGDIISVKGIFNQACLEHGGDTDIHVDKIAVLERGQEVSRPLEPRKIKASIILPTIAFMLIIIHLIVRRFIR